jgi:bifunctional DNase/RNase
MTETPEALRMHIRGLMLDPTSNVPIVILRDDDSDAFLPIWIGVFEANAIALHIEGQETARPMTHDLLGATIRTLGASVERIIISDLKESTFYARIVLVHGTGDSETTLELDARPSDALALALRMEAPIFVLQSVLDRAQAVEVDDQASDEEKIRKMLEELSPEDLGKYTM